MENNTKWLKQMQISQKCQKMEEKPSYQAKKRHEFLMPTVRGERPSLDFADG